MNTFHFLHASDLHLDSPFEGLSKVSPFVAERLRDASLQALDRLVEQALARGVAFVVIAGDLYDGVERGIRAQSRLRRAVERLSERKIGVFIVHGNHDPEGGRWNAIRNWPAGVHVFAHGHVEAIPVEKEGSRIATIYGISYGRRHETSNLAQRFIRQEAPGLHVALLHCALGEQPDHAPYSPCTLEDLRAVGMDYWALGHIHRSSITQENNFWIVYPGNTQGRSFKPSEQGAKGAVDVEVQDGKVVAVTPFYTDQVRFIELIIDIADLPDLDALRTRLEQESAMIERAHPHTSRLLRGRLVGRGPLHRALAKQGAREDFLKVLREDFVEHEFFSWWANLEDETRPELDFEHLRSRDDLMGAVTRMWEELRCDPQWRTNLKLELPLDAVADDESLDRAVADVLDLLDRAGEDA